MSAATVIVPSQSPAGGRLDRLLASLAAQTIEHETRMEAYGHVQLTLTATQRARALLVG